MDASSRPIKLLFGQDRRFLAPLFQRPYVWTRALQWAPLWEDVCAAAERRLHREPHQTHFLGAVVLDQVRVAVGELDARILVDGQQRLTTLQLMMTALRDLSRLLNFPRYERVLDRLTRNEDPMIRDPDEVFKVWPTYTDRPHLSKTLRAGHADVLRELYDLSPEQPETGHLIPDAYLYFWEAAQVWLGEPSDPELGHRLEQLVTAITQDLILVVIDLDSHDNAQLIFETLNARGAPLLPADLVKNMLFDMAVAQDESIERLYRDYWQQFDQEMGFWREEVRHGRDHMARIDAFLHHYLTLHEPTDPYGRGLYAAFRDHVRRNEARRASTHLASLHTYGELYRKLYHFDGETREGLFTYRMELLEASYVTPLLLEFLRHGTMAELRKMVVQLESYLVRRMLCGLSPRDHGRIIVQIVEALRARKTFTAAAVAELLKLLEGEGAVWPDDAMLWRAWSETPYYKHMQRRRLRMVLEALDLAMMDARSERVHLGEQLSIEHLMPVAWQAHWPLPETDDIEGAIARREALIDTVGNLTLLTQRLNTSLSHGAWGAKKKAILRHSALSMNRALEDEEDWDEDAIWRRTRGLFDYLVAVWPR